MAIVKRRKSFLANTLYSLRVRREWVQRILFGHVRELPHLYVAEKHPLIEFGWGNFFDALPALRQWQETPRSEFVELCKTPEKNLESTERDTAHLLYDLTRLLKAKRVIEVGVYRGAGSLHLAQGVADNGGGEIHLVDLDQSRLEEVKKKIGSAGLNVKCILHVGDAAKMAESGQVPEAEFIFLDANHYYDPILPEIVGYWKLVAPGGILAIHDSVLFEGTRRRANELFDQGQLVCTFATSFGSGISLVSKRPDASKFAMTPGLRGINEMRYYFDPEV